MGGSVLYYTFQQSSRELSKIRKIRAKIRVSPSLREGQLIMSDHYSQLVERSVNLPSRCGHVHKICRAVENYSLDTNCSERVAVSYKFPPRK